MRRHPRHRTSRSRPLGRVFRGMTGQALALFLSTWLAVGCAARPAPRLPDLVRRGVVDGIGYAKIEDGDIAQARKRAVQAALRDMALSARAVVRARSTYRLSAEEGKPTSESLDELVEVSAFQVLATRHMRENVDLKAGVYRVYLWLSEEELRESIEETRLARKWLLVRARRMYEAAKTETEKDPLEARDKLRKVRQWIDEARMQAEADGLAFQARVEALLKQVNAQIRDGNRGYDLADKALREGRLRSAAIQLKKARKSLPDAARSQKVEEGIEKKRSKVAELKREASDLQGEDKLEEALAAYQEAGRIDREDPEIRDAVTDLRASIAWKKRQRNRKIASVFANVFLVLGAAALIGVVAASGGTIRPHTNLGTWRR